MAKTLDYDFTAPLFNGTTGIEAQTGPTLTVTRAANATVMDYFNVLKTVGNNEPRFTGGRRVENLLLQSNDLSTTWTNTTSTDAQNSSATLDPFGGSAANELFETTDNALHGITQDLTLVLGNTYSCSCYIKGNGRGWCVLQFDGGAWQYFNLTTGAAGTKTGSLLNVKSEDMGNDWWRLSFAVVVGVSEVAAKQYIYCATADGTASYAGDVTKGLFVYGYQIEDVTGQADNSPSEYVATTTAAKAQWYATKRRTNLITYSRSLLTGWSASGSIIRSYDQVGLDGESNTATYLEDANASGFGINTESLTVPNDSEAHILRIFIKKDTDETRFPEFQFTFNGGTTQFTYAQINTKTGATAERSSAGVTSVESNSYGDWWELLISVANNSTGNTNVDIKILPAAGATLGTAVTSAVGSIVVGNIEMHKSSTFAENRGTDPIYTSGSVASSSFDTAITPTGLLIEEARTNICLYSEDFSTGWTPGGATLDAAAATAPDGTLTAARLNSTATLPRAYQAITTTDTDHAGSIYIKDDGAGYGGVAMMDANNQYIAILVDLSTGAVVDTSVGSTVGTITDYGTEDVGGGWWRVWVSGDFYVAGSCYLQTFSCDTASPVWATAGHPTSTAWSDGEDIFIWGGQLEIGSFLSSYIKTEAASVTRARDEIDRNLDLTWLDRSVGTFYIKATPPRYATSYTDDLQVLNYALNTSNYMEFSVDPNAGGTGKFKFLYRNSSTQNVQSAASAIAANTEFGVAVAYEQGNELALSVDGATLVTAATTTTAPTPSYTYIGAGVSWNEEFNGHIARIVYYNERLADIVLPGLSTGVFPVAASAGGSNPGVGLTFGKMGHLGLA